MPRLPQDQTAWRKPTPFGALLLQRLVGDEFKGAEALRRQLEGAEVRPVDEQGCVAIRAGGPDADGISIRALLHIAEGRLSYLEFCKDDASPVVRWPGTAERQVFHLPVTDGG